MGVKLFASILPVLLGFIGAILANIPLTLLGGGLQQPLLALMPIYYWCLVRPDLMNPVWVFIIGVVQDVLSGGPPGIWTASFVATYAVLDRQRDTFAGLSGWGALLGFATASLIACACAYGISVVWFWKWLPLPNFAMQFAVTVLVYVPVLFALGFIHRHLIGPLRSDF